MDVDDELDLSLFDDVDFDKIDWSQVVEKEIENRRRVSSLASSTRPLDARRRIENYFEMRRLREQLSDPLHEH